MRPAARYIHVENSRNFRCARPEQGSGGLRGDAENLQGVLSFVEARVSHITMFREPPMQQIEILLANR